MLANQRKKGFTVVELVIVIAVIAILAAVLIPTFTNIINKANESVDMQIVAQMNKALSAEEIVSGKPATVVAAKEILVANRCDDFTPSDAQNVFYWIGSENRVIIWKKDSVAAADADDQTHGKVIYPKNLATKFSGVTKPSADWDNLDTVYNETNYIEIAPDDGQPLQASDIINAMKTAADGAILQLPADTEVQLSQGGLYWLGQSLKMDGGTGKHLTLDLNGSTLESSGSNARFTRTEDGTGWLTDANGDYVMNVLEVPANGELVLANGKLDIQHGNQPSLAAVMTRSGSKLVLRDIDLDTTTAGVLPAGDASEVVIENSTINALNYALATNRVESSNIRVVIDNSELVATYSTAVMINTASDTHIYNSKITGVVHGIALRAGYLEITDSTIVTTDAEPGIYSYKAFAEGYGFAGWWHSGNTMPGGVLVVGDYAQANGDGSFSYSGNAIVEMTNTKLQSAAPAEVPEILLAASDPAKQVTVTYDEASTVGNVVVYGSVWTSAEVVDINHPGTIKVNGETKTLD